MSRTVCVKCLLAHSKHSTLTEQGSILNEPLLLEVFGWKELDLEALSRLTVREVKHILKDIAWRKVREVWREEAREHDQSW